MSLLADTVDAAAFFEPGGGAARDLGGQETHRFHENTIREMRMSTDGISVSKPLTDFHRRVDGA